MPLWLKQKLHLPREMRRGLRGRYRGRYVFTDHHESHAASAFFPSPFDEAAILTLDGVGEWSTTCFGVGRGNRIELTHEIRFPHSLGLLYSAFTYYTGFRVNSGEYKVMGLAPYGQPVYRDLILEHLIDLKEDGSFRMDMSYFNYCQGLTMTSPKFHRLFGGPPRKPESPLTQREMDLAASIQAVTEEIMLRMARHVHAQTGHEEPGAGRRRGVELRGQRPDPARRAVREYLDSAGGGRCRRGAGHGPVHLAPIAGKPRRRSGGDRQQGSFLGPAFTDDEIRGRPGQQRGRRTRLAPAEEHLCDEVAALMAQEKVVGWFQGRMEFGPRALGARSILGDARSPQMQSVMNLKIKFRESFRPFAPIVLREHVDEYFEMRPARTAPTCCWWRRSARNTHREPIAGRQQAAFGIDKLQLFAARAIPAVTHVDYSARVQTVDRERHPLLHRLLTRFYERTGCPVLINTSFNVRSEPIVCTPEDAYRCFMMTDMDVLVLGRTSCSRRNRRKRQTPTSARNTWPGLPWIERNSRPMKLVEVNWSPTDRQLRQFGTAALIALPLAAWWWARDSSCYSEPRPRRAARRHCSRSSARRA